MVSVKETCFYAEVIKELNYPFADLFIFNGFIISEIKRGVSFNWEEHAKLMTEDVACYLGTQGDDIIYISNRINSYSVVASDWLKFFKNRYSLKGYYIISEDKKGFFSSTIEGLFFSKKIKRFNSIFEAINWVKQGLVEIS